MKLSVELVDTIVSQYLKIFPEERSNLAGLIEQVVNEDVLNDRKTLPGHVTGSAFVLSPDNRKLLMLHHQYLHRWLQPGGHWDADEIDPCAAARREAEEETGVRILEQILVPDIPAVVPLDMDVQLIPANPKKDEPEHYHYDFRYVFRADTLELDTAHAEYPDAKWFSFDEVDGVGITRAIMKLRSYKLI